MLVSDTDSSLRIAKKNVHDAPSNPAGRAASRRSGNGKHAFYGASHESPMDQRREPDEVICALMGDLLHERNFCVKKSLPHHAAPDV
jgi:hypothetical protein